MTYRVIVGDAFVPTGIWAHADGHVTQSTLDYWREAGRGIYVCAYPEGSPPDTLPVAVSAITWVGDAWAFGATVVHPEHRGRGLGTRVLVQRLQAQRDAHPTANPISLVAADNVASLRMCARAGLHIVELRPAMRRSGPFSQTVLQSKKDNSECV